MERVLVRFADEHGKLRESVFKTQSIEELRRSLTERGFFILSETVLEQSFWEKVKALNPWYRRVSVRELIEFSQLLRTLLKAGLPLKDSLDVLLQEGQSGALNEVLGQIREDIVEGVSFSKALAQHPLIFPEMYVKTVVAGEKSGALETVLGRLVAYYQRSLSIRRKIIGAVIYPSILLFVATFAVIFLIVYVVPDFAELFRSLEIPLPVYTQFILDLSSFVGNYFLHLVFGIVLGLFFIFKYSQTFSGRLFFDRVKLLLPVVGDLEIKHVLSQFSRTLSTLLQGGIPIMESLEVVIDSLENKYFSQKFKKIGEEIEGGASFAKALKLVEGVPPTLVKIVNVGEESGNLGEMLAGVADHFDEEIEALTSLLTSLVEPILFLGIAGVVASIIIALLLPIFTAASTIKF